MATKGNNQSGERSRVRLIFAEAEGTATEIQQLIQSFAVAARGPQQVVVYPQQLSAPQSPAAALPAAPKHTATQPSLFDGLGGEEAEIVPVAPVPKPAASKAKRKLRTPAPVEGLEFTGGKISLKQYMDEQDAEEHSKRYLAIAFWLKEYRRLEEIGADHVYSCYRSLGWNVPDDVLSIFRGIKKNGWVSEGSNRGLFKINHIGEGQLKKIA